MSAPGLDPAWVAALRSRAERPPRRPRVALWAGAACIGSVEPDLFSSMPVPAGLVASCEREGRPGWEVRGELTASLREIAFTMREAGIAHAWRDEQLAVTDGAGQVLGTVERAVVRPLGIATRAVHLVGLSPDGRHWIQQRSWTKPNDPGLWDTLMGGMVPATDTIAQALERETWEEAGLGLQQLSALVRGGEVRTRRPSGESGCGYVVEHITWFRCVVPEGISPKNQDGEVEQFSLSERPQVLQRLERDEFTTEAALILVDAGI